MHCPVCKDVLLRVDQLEDNLPTMRCQCCEEHWLKYADYATWLSSTRGDAKAPANEDDMQSIELLREPAAAKLCPACGRFLIKHKVGHGVAFHLDKCGNCGGIWLDRQEWQALKSNDLHDLVHLIFTDSWQKSVADLERQIAHEANLCKRIGEADWAKLKEIARWTSSHEHRDAILAYLASDG